MGFSCVGRRAPRMFWLGCPGPRKPWVPARPHKVHVICMEGEIPSVLVPLGEPGI